MSENKTKAPRNKTIEISDSEAESLRKRLFVPARSGKIRADEFVGRTILGDCVEILPRLPESFADLVICDPPYNLSKKFGDFSFRSMDSEQYEEYLESWLPALCRIVKPTGSLYLCGDWKCTASLQRVLERNMTVLNRITWQREKGRGASRNWKNSMEDIWFAVKNPAEYVFNIDDVKVKRRVLAPYTEKGIPKDWEFDGEKKFRLTYPSNFWDDITVPFWSMPENTEHPTQKPEKLYAKLILASSNPGDIVFDPFLGSGTASVVAKKLGRRFAGIEIDERYCLLAEKRLVLAETDATIQGYGDGVFWERNSAAQK